MGLNLSEFLQLSFNELYQALKQKTKEDQEQMKLMRLHAFLTLQPYMGEDSEIESPEDICKWGFEDED